MNFNTDVDRGFVDSILESSLWKKAQIEVVPREVVNESSEEGEFNTVPDMESQGNEYSEPQDFEDEEEEAIEEDEDENVSFSLDDLQVVLDNLEEDDLMEHALSMLEVFDVAYEQLTEDEEEYDEEDDEALDEGKPARGRSRKRGRGPGPGGGKKERGTGKVPSQSNMRRSDQTKSTVFPAPALDDGEQ